MKHLNTSTLENKLDKLENYIPYFEKINLKVSKVTVGWHLDHSLKVINTVITTTKKSDVSLYKNNFSFLGKVLFTLGFFPKGKAKAPKYVMPPEIIMKSEIIAQLDLAKENFKELENLAENSFFKHPLFGNVNSKKIPRFLTLHTNHHLKIIKDILG